MKTITEQEARQLIYDVAAHAIIYVNHNSEKKTILGNCQVFNTNGIEIPVSDNKNITDVILQIIINSGGEFEIYSSYFNYSTGRYKLI